MTYESWLALLRPQFPRLDASNSRPTSPVDETYNCIAWAADETERWWWPDAQEQQYWPAGVQRVETVGAFVQAYGLLGYLHRSDASLEPGRQKVAIFAKELDRPTHASRQLPDGWWTSKLGGLIDIEHELFAVEGPAYGNVAVVLGRNAESA